MNHHVCLASVAFGAFPAPLCDAGSSAGPGQDNCQDVADSDEASLSDDVHDGMPGLDRGIQWEMYREAIVASFESVREWMGDELPQAVQVGSAVHYKVGDHRVARETIIRSGTNSESFSVYCYMHQCKIVHKVDKYPGRLRIQQWLKAGMGLPRGAAGTRGHTASFPKV